MITKLNNKQRKNIVRISKNLIELNVKDYDNLPGGEQELILDQYINEVCEKQGYNLSEFYNENGRTLNEIL